MGKRWGVVVGVVALVAVAVGDEKPISLFNGKDLTGWSAHFNKPNAKVEDAWSVRDGVLVCTGKPIGYIKTDKQFENYRLTLEWRFPEGSPGGNSGVLLHVTTPNALGVWPKSVEAQLNSGDAGDIWVIGTTVAIEDAQKRVKGRRHLNLTDGAEKPIGQWNRYDIVCDGDEITLKVNGELVNYVTDSSVQEGAIGLQSEGAPIEFRRIELTPLKP